MKAILFVLLLVSCGNKTKTCDQYRNNPNYGYAKCIESGLVIIMDREGNIVCKCHEKPMTHEEAQLYLNSKY